MDDKAALVLAVAGELLDRQDLSLEDDFFSVGGDSLIAMHLVGRLSRLTGLRLRVTALFANPLLTDFVAYVDQLRQSSAVPAGETDSPLAAALEAARSTRNPDGHAP